MSNSFFLKKSYGYNAVIFRQSLGDRSMTLRPPCDGSTFSFLDLFLFPPFVLGAISTDNTSRNVKLYNFGTRMPKTTRRSHSHSPHGLRAISVRRLRRLHDFRRISEWSLYGYAPVRRRKPVQEIAHCSYTI